VLSLPANSSQRGRQAEALAEHWLAKRGLKPLNRNWRAGRGEIDLIMLDGHILVFVEVRSRREGARVSAAESLDFRKLQKLRETAARYLQANPAMRRRACRFDVVTVTGDLLEPQFQWIRDAFQ